MFRVLILTLIVGAEACTKGLPIEDPAANQPGVTIGLPNLGVFQEFTIQPGTHTSDQSKLISITTTELRFIARFDQSAVYTTQDSINQSDINKLYGFSEGLDNQYNSARIGWCWLHNALRLFAYVYTNGMRSFKEIGIVKIGEEIKCSIKPTGTSYVFTVNETKVAMDRGTNTSVANGLLQFPYFGGDEKAPHKITIQIKNL